MESSTKQHYLPATYIGNFSCEETKSRRKRSIWVSRKSTSKIYKQTAENVAAHKGIYPKMIDDMWTVVEKNLQYSIDQLISNKQVDADSWSNIVRFISQLFIRPPEFSVRFKDRFSRLGKELQKLVDDDNCQLARAIEMQRLYSPIMYSDWKVLHNVSQTPFITNDIGYTLTKDISGKLGYTIPLDKNAALLITKSIYNREYIVPIYYDKLKKLWLIEDINHVYCNKDSVLSLNNALFNSSIEEIYGSSKDIINKAKKTSSNIYKHKTSCGPFALIPNQQYLIKHEMDFFKVIEIISRPPDDSVRKLVRNFEV